MSRLRTTPLWRVAPLLLAALLPAKARGQAAPAPLPELPALPDTPPQTPPPPWLHKAKKPAEPAEPSAPAPAATRRKAPKRAPQPKQDAAPAEGSSARATNGAAAPAKNLPAPGPARDAAPVAGGSAAPFVASPPPPPAAGESAAAVSGRAGAQPESTGATRAAAARPAAIVKVPVPAPQGATADALPLPPLKLQVQVAVLAVRGGAVDEPVGALLEAGLRDVAAAAPMSQKPLSMQQAAPACDAEDDACLAGRAAQDGADLALVATSVREGSTVALRVRVIDVTEKRRTAQTVQTGLPEVAALLRASAEAQACLLLVPAGCRSEVRVEAEPGSGPTALLADGGAPVAAAGKARLALAPGVHALQVTRRGIAGPERLFAVLLATRETLRVRDSADGPALFTDAELAAAAPVAVAAVPSGAASSASAPSASAPSAAVPSAPTTAPAAALAAPAPAGPAGHRAFRLPAALGLGGAGLVALAAGAIQGARSGSMLSDAESAYRAHGNTYLPSDLGNVSSGNSAARSANVLFVAGALFAAAGAGVFLAF